MLKEPRCFTRGCKHFMGVKQDKQEESTERPICRAFPNGIPNVIAYGQHDHLEAHPGDHGIQFEKE